MIIQSIKVEQFRHLDTNTYQFDPSFNLIIGKNASGKTSLLEAIYFLSHLKSFRTNLLNQVISYDTDYFRVFAEVASAELTSRIGIERNKQEVIVRKDHQTITRRSLLAKLLPVLFIGPDTGQLLVDSPRFRRQFMDWGLFQGEPIYHQLWLRFDRALKQRNAALKARMNDATLSAIEQELGETGMAITSLRDAFIMRLFTPLTPLLQQFIGDHEEWSISYHQGFTGSNYHEELEKGRAQERILGYTRTGPHRSDFTLLCERKNVGYFLSRGQIKLATIALMLAQISLYREATNQSTILLLDDITAELDQEKRRILVEELMRQQSQLFVTCLEKSEFPELYRDGVNSSMSCYELTDGVSHKVV